MELSVAVYDATRGFPRAELYGLVSQARRASVPVAANIAEGNARRHAGDYLRHLSFARGSVAEVETLLEMSARLGYLSTESKTNLIQMAERVGQMLNRLMQAIERKAGKDAGPLH